jgi:acyl-CoA synthetase (AMP-forming)/AMP-acid ligase II
VKGPPPVTPRHDTLAGVLAAAARAPEAGLTFVDLRERETSVSWAELRALARALAARLVALGVEPGDRVAIVLPTSPEFVTAFFGVSLAAAVPVPLYPPARLGRLSEYNAATARLVAAAGARLLLTDARIRTVLGETVERAWMPLGCRTLERLPEAAGSTLPPAARPDDLALIQFSSGSTREPRPVALTQRALTCQLAMLDATVPHAADGEERGVSWLPLYHDMGLIAGPLLAAWVPGTLVLIPPEHFLVRPALWLRALGRHRATLTPAPAFALGLCVRRITDRELQGVDLGALRLLTCGAEPIAAEAVRRFTGRFSAWGLDPEVLCPVYGLSEAALAVTFSPLRRPLRAIGVDAGRLAATGEVVAGERAIVSVGRPLPGVEVEVRDRAGGPLPERRVGRIWVRSPSLMSGYFGRSDDTAATLVGGWLDTGDLGFVADGELHVSGRARDVVIVRGANRDAHEFEACLAAVEGVRPGCAAAVGFLPPGADGEALMILAERDPARPGGPEAIQARVRDAVLQATGIAPHAVVLLEPGVLPRTSSGKLRRAEALRLHLAGELGPPPGAGPLQLAGALARSARGFLRARRPRSAG